MVLIGWPVYWLAKIEPQLAGDRSQSEELFAVFQECKELFRASLKNPEVARREFDLTWYDALQLKAEYVGVAERLAASIHDLATALNEAATPKGRAEVPRPVQELKGWIGKQTDRAALERLEARSRELQERVVESQLQGTNGPVIISADLGSLLKETDRAYESYLANLKEVGNNAGKLLVGAFVAQCMDQPKKPVPLLAALAAQPRQSGKPIALLLESKARSDSVKRTRRQDDIIRAFLEAASPAEFAARIRNQSGKAGAEPATQMPSLRRARYGLLAALTGMGVFLIVDLYWRIVVMPLRMKLVERETIIEHQEKLAAFEQLAATLAHEIRNPLTTINARLYTVQRKLQEGTPERKDAMVIGTEIDRVTQILKEFMQLTRPSPPELGLMTAEPLLHEVRDMMAPQLQRQGIRLECPSDGTAPFFGDRQQLRQVLLNLVQNAAESIQRNGVIVLRARDACLPFKGADTPVAIIEVEDNGPGVPAQIQGRLFDPFFSTRKDGTGLGLPISARIIDRHGGTLDFETEIGRGTTFRIVLPAHTKQWVA